MKKDITQLHNITPEVLELSIRTIVDNAFKKYYQKKETLKQIEWLTRKEAAAFLGVSLVTIHDWSYNKHILKPYKISNRIRFKKSDIEDALLNSRR